MLLHSSSNDTLPAFHRHKFFTSPLEMVQTPGGGTMRDDRMPFEQTNHRPQTNAKLPTSNMQLDTTVSFLHSRIMTSLDDLSQLLQTSFGVLADDRSQIKEMLRDLKKDVNTWSDAAVTARTKNDSQSNLNS